jgi:hypothetical protein
LFETIKKIGPFKNIDPKVLAKFFGVCSQDIVAHVQIAIKTFDSCIEKGLFFGQIKREKTVQIIGQERIR